MFNIKDSYITPIILSYVDKYIKNIRLEDTQLSLWGGEAVFHNLSLRLDVLEQELALPFSFVSGQIHELAITVPWTKLHSEPIKVTINTIECVLKLKTDATANLDSASTSSTGSKEARKKGKRPEVESPPGYVQSLVNRIVSNVTIECNNLILKYVEEDMVLSLNVRSLLLQSANQKWQPAFTELSVGQLILRKLVTLHDLTVCLDRRNASGKIEFYEEPLLYRCSLELHLSRTYGNIASSRANEMRIDVRCGRMDFSVSDQQLPMLLRVLRLALALYMGELQESTGNRGNEQQSRDEDTDEAADIAQRDESGDSWVGWAWSFVPSILPNLLDEEEWNPDQQGNLSDHKLLLGFFVDQLSMVFKASESSSDRPYYGPKKIKFVPMASLEVQGCYMESMVAGMRAVGVTLGASQMVLRPVGETCACGVADVPQANTQQPTLFLSVGSECNNYLKGSLFDLECDSAEKHVTLSWDEHLASVTEGVLLDRTPAFAIDYRYMLDIPEDVTPEQLSELGSDLEFSNFAEQALCRFVIGPMQIHVCSGLIHRVQQVLEAASLYNYPPYCEPISELTRVDLVPPTLEDVNALESSMPLRAYQLTVFKPIVHLYVSDHPPYQPNCLQGKRRSKVVKLLSVKSLSSLPCLSIECQCLDATHVKPMYPRRLLTTACQLATPSEDMFTNCHRHTNLKLLGLGCHLVVKQQHMTVIVPSHVALHWKRLINAQLWCRQDLALSDISVDTENVTATATKAQLLIMTQIIKSCFSSSHQVQGNIAAYEEACTGKNLPYLEFSIEGFSWQRVLSSSTATHRLFIKSTRAFALRPLDSSATEQVLILSSCDSSQASDVSEPMLALTLQYPTISNATSAVLPSLVILKLRSIDVCLDPLLLNWLSFSIVEQFLVSDSPVPQSSSWSEPANISRLPRRKSGSLESKSRTATAPQESVHSFEVSRNVETIPVLPTFVLPAATSITTEHKTEIPWWKSKLLQWYTEWCCALVCIEIAPATIYIPKQTLSSLGAESIADTLLKSVSSADVCIVKMPLVILKSSNQRQGLHVLMAKLPVTLPPAIWKADKETFPWSLTIHGLSCDTVIQGNRRVLLHSVNANCTIGISTKLEQDVVTSVGFCVHIDTPLLQVSVSNQQVVLLITMLDTLTSLTAIEKNVSVVQLPIEIQPSPTPPATITAPSVHQHPQSVGSISEPSTQPWLGINESDEASSATDNSIKLTVWLQWTLARLLLSLYATTPDSEIPNLKLACDLEDMMTSVDIQQVYLKVKSKVATASVLHFVRNEDMNEWQAGQHLGLIVRCNDDMLASSTTPVLTSSPGGTSTTAQVSAHGLLDVTFTRAQSKNVHKRWAQQVAAHNTADEASNPASSVAVTPSPRFISEIVIKLCPVDLLLSAPVFNNFLPIFEPFLSNPKNMSSSSLPLGMQINNNTLPLLYLDTKDIRVFLPISSLSKNAPDFCITQVDSVNLAPHVFNPLSRVYVRPDIYHMAQQANILSVPGSQVEDRQYQLDIRKFCIQTGTWLEVEKFLQSETQSAGGELNPLSENPAVEWNKLAVGKETLRHAEISLLPLVHRFDVSLMVAPAIVYQQPGITRKEHQDVLVCGHSAELNATSDIELSVSMDQMTLLSHLTAEWLQLVSSVSQVFKHISPQTQSDNLAPVQPDSGIDDQSSICSPSIRKVSKVRHAEFIPTEILITASKITLILYETNEVLSDACKTEKKEHKVKKKSSLYDSNEELPSDQGYEASEESSVENIEQSQLLVQPLMYVLVSQPHSVLACHSLKQRVELSCFDLAVRTSSDTFLLRNSCSTKQIPRIDRFGISLLETKGGDPHPKTGIPPSLLTTTWSNFLSNSGGQLRLDIGRPLHLHCGVSVWNSLLELQSCLEKCIQPLHNLLFDKTTTANVSEVKSEQSLLAKLWEIPSMSIKSNQIVVTVNLGNVDANEVAVSVAKISGNISSRSSVVKGVGTIKSQVEVSSFMLRVSHKGRHRILIHPWSFNSDTVLAWESWLPDPNNPILQTSFNCDCISVDIGPDQIQCLQAFLQPINILIEKFITPNNKIEPISPFSFPPSQDENYRDDLRAGAFQFVECISSQELPLPYQVIFSQSPPSMAWRYPQPRILTRTDIFPVPFISAGGMKQEGDQVACILQYWSECQSRYMTYCHFNLSESQVCRLDLPSANDTQRAAAASAWRVLLQPHSEDEDEEQGYKRVSVPPRALAACMRVDSYFCPSVVPPLQVSISIATLQLNSTCQLANLSPKLPSPLSPYTYDGLLPESLPLLSIIFDTSKLCLSRWSCGTILNEFETKVRCESIDMATLTKINIIESFRVGGKVYSSHEIQERSLEISLISQPIIAKFGSAAGHTLATTLQLWKHSMDSNSHCFNIIPSRYVICNDLTEAIRFKQFNTGENILLSSRQCHMYAWKSTCQEQFIQIALAETGWEWSKKLSADTDASEVLYFENSQRKVGIVWKVESISTTQKMITVSGQLLVSNLLAETLELQLTTAKEDVSDATSSHCDVYTIQGHSTPASFLLQHGKKVVLKLRFQSLAGAWSGEIPLAVNTAVFLPWLVKIPLQEKGQFLSIWCRIFIQDLRQGSKILVVLAPLYSVRSLLPADMHLAVSTPGLDVQMSVTVMGQGKQHQLYCPGTVEHSHQVTFLPESANILPPKESTSVPLSYAMPQQPTNLILKGDKIDVDHICKELQVASPNCWPYIDTPFEDVEWIECAQPPTQVEVSYELQAPHYSTLLLQLRPWALLVNLLHESLSLESTDWDQSCRLTPKGVIVPPRIEGTFQLSLGSSPKWLSPPLQLACEEWNGSFYMPRISGVVPVQGSIHTTITSTTGSLQLVSITSRVLPEESNLRVLSVQPTVLLSCTFTPDCPLSILGVCVPIEEKLLPLPQLSPNLYLNNPNTTQPVTCWTLLTVNSSNIMPKLSADLAFYLLLQDSRQKSNSWCCPLLIPLPGSMDGCASRQSFALGDMSLVLTTHFRGGEVIAVFSKEQQSQLILNNSCNFPLIFSQSRLGAERGENVVECEHLKWQCHANPGCSVPYTMPAVQQAFPDLDSLATLPSLLLAMPNSDNQQQTVWSEPVSVSCSGNSEQFVRIPGHGDVRIRMMSVSAGTNLVHIECVSRIEISAKEIRARLQPSSQQHEQITTLLHQDNLMQSYEETIAALGDISDFQFNMHPASNSQNKKQHLFVTVYAKSIQLNLTCDTSVASSELLLLTLDDACISLRPLQQRDMGHEVALSIGDIQLDNQMFHQGGFDFPVILMRQEPFKQQNQLDKLAIEQIMERVRKYALLNVRVVEEKSSVLQSVHIAIKPLNVYVEDTLLMQLSKIMQNISPSQLIVLSSTTPSIGFSLPVDVQWEAHQTANPLQMQSLVIAPLSLMVSLHTSLKVFIALDRSPLLFSAFERHRVCTTSYRLGHALTRHYLSGALFRAGWVVGSLELLGSPGGFALTVGSGLRDFICLPYLGILQGPWGFLTGVTHGSASLMKHVTAGTLSSITNLASSVARNLERCSLDREHVERAEEARRQRPQGVGQGILQGLSSLGISLLGAVSGIAHHPLQAIVHQNSGSSPLTGLVAGVGLGLVGAITKPLSGAAELVALTGQGLLHGAGWSSLPQSRHKPIVEECSTRCAASLRYSWKVLPPGEGPLLVAVEVTAISPGGQYEAAALVLSPQLLTVVATDCDQVRSVIPTSQLKVMQDTGDPTLLSLCMDQFRSSSQSQESPHARVEEYVRHTGMVFLNTDNTLLDSSDALLSDSSSMTSSSIDINPGMLRFHVNPQHRDHLQNVIMLAQRQAQGRGFSTL